MLGALNVVGTRAEIEGCTDGESEGSEFTLLGPRDGCFIVVSMILVLLFVTIRRTSQIF
jgi:hypothetical protein